MNEIGDDVLACSAFTGQTAQGAMINGAITFAGGAVYDAIVALAAVAHDADLATRDIRAKATYETGGARVVIAG